MPQRFVTIWFRHLRTDWHTRRQPSLKNIPFVLSTPDHGRMMVSAVNKAAQQEGIDTGMVVADARALVHGLQVMDDQPGHSLTILKGLGEWCLRYTPSVVIDGEDGLILDASGCAHLWGGEQAYLLDMGKRFNDFGYDTRIAMAGTIGAAWALSRFGTGPFIIANGKEAEALYELPTAALRLATEHLERLYKLGLRQVKDLLVLPRTALRRRFGKEMILRLDQALGKEEEILFPLQPIEPYQERLPCLEPIFTRTGIEIALQRLLEMLTKRLQQEGKGLRTACLKGYRIDGRIVKMEISTNHPSYQVDHLLKLFALKLSSFEPAPGIEVFTLEAGKVEETIATQEKLWTDTRGLDDMDLSQLLDRLSTRFGETHIKRYLPDEHYWPERSVKQAVSLRERPLASWKTARPRPLQLLPQPELIEVTAPVPDYPPMLFRYKGQLHKIAKADGPERIEQEWWLQEGQHRDYYYVEDESGNRYWLFRLGHYDAAKTYSWYLHGFFA